jgi:dihydroxyacetone kinase-like predicted kinase
MKFLVRAIPASILYFCLATVVAEAGALAYLASQGVLTKPRLFQCLAALYGVNLHEIEKETTAENQAPPNEQPAFAEVIKQRAKISREFEIREVAIDKALVDVRALTAQLRTERERYDQLKQQFDARLQKLEEVFTDSSLQEVQRTLEVINPKQAKDQILRMLAEAGVENQERVQRDVVTILKTMPLDKRKKILAEFKTDEEAEKLHEILKQIREGVPDITLIRETRAQLAQFARTVPAGARQ